MAQKVETGIIKPQNDDGILKEGLILEHSVSSLKGSESQYSGNVFEQFQEPWDNNTKIELQLEKISSKTEEMLSSFQQEKTHQRVAFQEIWDTIKKMELPLEIISSKNKSLEEEIAYAESMEDNKNVPTDVNRAAEQVKRAKFIYGKKNVAKWLGPILR